MLEKYINYANDSYYLLNYFDRAIAIIIHGAGEHCGRYDEMAELFRKESIYSFANDHG